MIGSSDSERTRTRWFINTFASLFFGAYGSHVVAQASQPVVYSQSPGASCADVQSKIGEAFAAAQGACLDNAGCIQQALDCQSGENSAGAKTLAGNSVGESCADLVNTACPDSNAGMSTTAREEKRDAGVVRRDAMTAKERATDDFQKAQTANVKAQNDAAEQMVKLRQEYRDKREKIIKEEEDAMAEAQKAKLQAVKEAQQEYDKIDTEYIAMRNELRLLADKISNGDLTWKTSCRATALSKSKEVQTEMDKRMAEEDRMVSQINNQSSGLFGLRFRRLNKKRKRIADQYNEALVRCLKGELEPGANMKIELDWSISSCGAGQFLRSEPPERQRRDV